MNILKTRTSIILISILWGLGIASLFHRACKDGACEVYRVKDPSDITKHIYRNNGKCYKFNKIDTACHQKQY